MNIVIAPNALKGSLSARDAAAAIAEGIHAVAPDACVQRVPLADGGDGLLDVVTDVLRTPKHNLRVHGPRGAAVDASYCYDPVTCMAVIESAQAAGLVLLRPSERNARLTSTRGVGELIAAALEQGARTIMVGIGGSATCDCGTGMAAALGVRFLDAHGAAIEPCGDMLPRIAHIDVSHRHDRLNAARIIALCDVDNPLHGPRGAAQVFAPQKGATPDDVAFLDRGLAHCARLIACDLGCDVAALPGAGAAGGLGAGLVAFADADLQRGAEAVLDLVHFDELLQRADLVITAEGRLDAQSAGGKTPVAVARRARRRGIPCIALAGAVADDASALLADGITAAFSICPGPVELDDAIQHAAVYLRDCAARVMRLFLAGRR